ncbi:MAG TPA: hypothetical protein VF167_07610 [Longimicrobiaceae bacterium]
MAFPPKPPPCTTDPTGKAGIADDLVEKVRRANALAGAEAQVSEKLRRVIDRCTGEKQSVPFPGSGTRRRPDVDRRPPASGPSVRVRP